MSKTRANSTTVKVAIPNDILQLVDSKVKEAAQPRSHWILDSITSRIDGTVGVPLQRCNIPLAVSRVLKEARGKLTRPEAEHITSLVIIALASNDQPA